MYWRISETLEKPVPNGLRHEVASEDHEHVGRVYSSEDVRINGKTDTTFKLIRAGLELKPYETEATRPPSIAGKKRDHEETFGDSVYAIIIEDGQVKRSPSASRPVTRTHTRILLESYGWPIKYFLDLRELLRILAGGITGNLIVFNIGEYYNAGLWILHLGHKFLYLLCRILHRDISIGNILIHADLSYNANADDTHGQLIDLDHAKATKTYHRLYQSATKKVPARFIRDLRMEGEVDPQLLALVHARVLAMEQTLDRPHARMLQDYFELLIPPGVDPRQDPISHKDAHWDFKVF